MSKTNPVTDYLAEYGQSPLRDGLEKQAGFGQWYSKQAPITRRVIEGAGVFAATQLAAEAYGGIRGAVQKAHGFRSMLKHNPALEKHDRKKVHAIYNTLHNVSPDLARDPVVASSWVNRMMYQDEYVDPRTMSDLATAQQRMSQSRNAFDPYKLTSALQQARGDENLFMDPSMVPKPAPKIESSQKPLNQNITIKMPKGYTPNQRRQADQAAAGKWGKGKK